MPPSYFFPAPALYPTSLFRSLSFVAVSKNYFPEMFSFWLLQRGEQVITRLGVDLESWENIIVLNAMTIIYYTLSFFGLFFSKVS